MLNNFLLCGRKLTFRKLCVIKDLITIGGNLWVFLIRLRTHYLGHLMMLIPLRHKTIWSGGVV